MELLVVDDEAHIREGICSRIPWKNHGVSLCGAAANAAEALAILEKSFPDILILDIRMPDMDGLELLEILRATYPGIRAILISGHDDFEYAQRAISLGAFAYLLKPLDHDELRDTVLKAKAAIERQQAMVRKDEELQAGFRQSLPVLRDNFFLDLAEGRLTDEEQIRDRAGFLSVDLDGSHSLALAVLAERPSHACAGPDEDGFVRFALRSQAEKLLRGLAPAAHCFPSGESLGVILRGSPPPREAVLGCCRELKTWANASLRHALSVGVGRTHRGLASGAALSWQEAREALQHRIIIGRNEIIDAESLGEAGRRAVASGSFERTLKLCDAEALAALERRDEAALLSMAGRIAAAFVASAAADIGGSRRLLFFLAFFLTRLAFALDCDERATEGDVQTELARPRTRGELERYLLEFFKRLLDDRAEKDAQRNGHLVRLAKETVDGGAYGDISLSAVAQRLSVHPSYLSRVFRQEMRESFHEYATRARMAEARRLLKATTLRVHEIAESLNYRDVNHFTKVFRKVVGVSPSEFRELG